MNISTLDSERLYNSFLSGAHEVIKNKNSLNEINVFPVADGDTGSNLSSTMHAIIMDAKISGSVKETMNSVCVNLFYAKFRNLTCTAYLEMF